MRTRLLNRPRHLLHAACCLVLTCALLAVAHYLTKTNAFYPRLRAGQDGAMAPTMRSRVTTVVASQIRDNTTWLPLAFPDWEHIIYVADDQSASHTVPLNKGRESMTYLTYIIDNYDSLPDVIIFQHANRYQWHNDDPLYDGQRSLSRLQIPVIREEGYVNLRCVWTLGCPSEIRPFKEEGSSVPNSSEDDDSRAGSFYKHAFEELFPERPVPEDIGVSCCAQFAAAGWKIRERPKSDYERYRRWLLSTSLSDDLSGRILEYSWHIILGQESVYCPDAASCYCRVYGLCDLECQERGKCHSQYTLPQYATLPDGWPNYGWEGEWQNATAM